MNFYDYSGAQYYDCLSINEYKEEVFDEDDDYVIITSDDNCDNGSLILTHKPNRVTTSIKVAFAV